MLFGVHPPEPPEDTKDKKPTGVTSAWLAEHFGTPPEVDAQEGVVARFACAWLWQLVAGFLLPYSSGNTISWMWLKIIGQDWENIATFSWGSAALGWLYRQMCDACRRSGENANLGGCAYLLQLWMWSAFLLASRSGMLRGYVLYSLNRLPIFLFSLDNLKNLITSLFFPVIKVVPLYDQEPLATVGWLWSNIDTVHGNPGRRYVDYSNALDCLSAAHGFDPLEMVLPRSLRENLCEITCPMHRLTYLFFRVLASVLPPKSDEFLFTLKTNVSVIPCSAT
ncbi:hypothetical protein C2845_PM13G22500 [Panicum miliaceum]|uniref:Aminotransferase-like plant mobile domain-containing protein n=1 Tax=Panicum miliaceum TaxID=4540 RepID=A0A3L6RJK5_PANMI|nr:hypothetical protein C2845_PM13G22500 [Panicum miliaceum]